MPQLGETVTEGTITKWYKAVGDQVARDEPLFEVSTDKVDSEVPSPAEGVLTAILVEEGDTVDVGVTLAVIGDAASPSNGAGSRPTGLGRRLRAPLPDRQPRRPRRGHAGPAPARGGAPSRPAPTPVPGRRPRHASVAPPRTGPCPSTGPARGSVLSPVVRRLLNEHGIDPAAVRGTGLGGRITRGDVEAVIAEAVTATPAGAEHLPPPSRHRRRRASPTGGAPAPAPPPAPSTAATRLPTPTAAPVPRPGTRWSPSPTSAGAPPSTWCGPRPPRPTP